MSLSEPTLPFLHTWLSSNWLATGRRGMKLGRDWWHNVTSSAYPEMTLLHWCCFLLSPQKPVYFYHRVWGGNHTASHWYGDITAGVVLYMALCQWHATPLPIFPHCLTKQQQGQQLDAGRSPAIQTHIDIHLLPLFSWLPLSVVTILF